MDLCLKLHSNCIPNAECVAISINVVYERSVMHGGVGRHFCLPTVVPLAVALSLSTNIKPTLESSTNILRIASEVAGRSQNDPKVLRNGFTLQQSLKRTASSLKATPIGVQ
jgi:hypothetical protein